jgi:hypothetical protein
MLLEALNGSLVRRIHRPRTLTGRWMQQSKFRNFPLLWDTRTSQLSRIVRFKHARNGNHRLPYRSGRLDLVRQFSTLRGKQCISSGDGRSDRRRIRPIQDIELGSNQLTREYEARVCVLTGTHW